VFESAESVKSSKEKEMLTLQWAASVSSGYSQVKI
jgi:hypothetical protein